MECIQAAQISYGYDDNDANNYLECLELFEDSLLTDNHINQFDSSQQNLERKGDCLLKIFLRPTKNKKCARCRRFNIDAKNDSDVCQRCFNVLKL